MGVEGNLDRDLSPAEIELAAKAGRDFMAALGSHPRELATYSLSLIVKFMAAGNTDDALALLDVLKDLEEGGRNRQFWK